MSWLSIITYNSIYMNMYDLILFFEVDFNCAYAEFDVFCMSSTNEIISTNVYLVRIIFWIFFLFSKASEYCSDRQKLHSNFLTSRGSGHVRFAEKPGWGTFMLILCLYNTIVWEKFHNRSSLVNRFGFETLGKLSRRNVLCLIWFAKK